MTTIDSISLAISILSLCIASFAAYKAQRLSHSQIRLANRSEFQKMLLELNKELVANPHLWAIWDSHPMRKHMSGDTTEKAKLEAFTYMHLNMFEVVFTFFEDDPKLLRTEKATWQQWDRHLCAFLKGCSLAREIMTNSEVIEMYSPSFLKRVHACLSNK